MCLTITSPNINLHGSVYLTWNMTGNWCPWILFAHRYLIEAHMRYWQGYRKCWLGDLPELLYCPQTVFETAVEIENIGIIVIWHLIPVGTGPFYTLINKSYNNLHLLHSLSFLPLLEAWIILRICPSDLMGIIPIHLIIHFLDYTIYQNIIDSHPDTKVAWETVTGCTQGAHGTDARICIV